MFLREFNLFQLKLLSPTALHHEAVRMGIILNFRFGRKKVIVTSLILAAVSSIGAVLFTTEDNSNKGLLSQMSSVNLVSY